LKALLKSVHTAFCDFSETFNSPFKVSLLLLFILSGFSAPLIKCIAKLIVTGIRVEKEYHSDDEDSIPSSIILVGSSNTGPVNPWKRAMSNVIRRRVSHVPEIEFSGP
tara:strand:+ start:337 stop:660 length:324 start_codon:yes stop_codon:yes gene_type:complete